MKRKTLAETLTYEFLYEQYVTLNKPSEQIGREIGCSGRQIRNYLAMHNIPRILAPRNHASPSAASLEALRTKGYSFPKGHTPWNKGMRGVQTSWAKGLTKETHPSIARIAEAKLGRKRPEWSGELHPNWKGDAVTEALRIRSSNEYKAWRTAVFARDDYCCQDCGKRGGRLQAHHLKPFATHPDERLDIANGVTLCRSCHAIRHPEKPELRGRVMSEEQKAKLRAANKGRTPWNKGLKGVTVAWNKGRKSSQPSWNKGLTKKDHPSIASMAEKNSQRMTGKKGPESPVWQRWHPHESATDFQPDAPPQ